MIERKLELSADGDPPRPDDGEFAKQMVDHVMASIGANGGGFSHMAIIGTGLLVKLSMMAGIPWDELSAHSRVIGKDMLIQAGWGDLT